MAERELEPDADPVAVARSIVLTRLTAAPRSRAELATTLAERGVPDDAAREVLDRFTELGLVDDRAYAELLVRTRHEQRGLARRALGAELRRRGVDDELAQEALEGLAPEDEAATARRLVQARLRTMGRLDAETKRRRLAAMLARKGYSAGLAYAVVRDAVASEADDSEDGFGVDPHDGPGAGDGEPDDAGWAADDGDGWSR